METAIAAIVLGLIELLFGRKVFWLMVAIGGFLIGWFFAPAIFDSMVDWQRIVVGLAFGVVLGLLSLLLFRLVVAVGGFFFVGTATVILVRHLGLEAADGSVAFWLSFVIGGVIGAVLLFLLIDWGLIVLSSLVGAGAVTWGIITLAEGEPRWLDWVLFIVLAAIGLVVQIWTFKTHPSMPGRRG